MEKNKKIVEEVAKTISLIDKIEKIEANPFLFTRIKSEIESTNNRKRIRIYSVALKALSVVIVLIMLAFNFYSVKSYLKSEVQSEKIRQEYLNNISSEYSLNQANEYLTNLDHKE